MAGEEEFDLEVEFSKCLTEVDKTETLLEDFDSEAAQGHAEVLDQTIGLLHPMSHCYDHGPGGYSQKNWVGCAAHLLKPLPYL